MKTLNFKPIYVILCLTGMLCIAQGCKKKDDPQPSPELGDLLVVDGNHYRTIKIGDQWWMAENLKVTHYRDGSPVFEISSGEAWSNDSIGARYKKSNLFVDVGLLYNYYAVSNKRNIAPAGWHVPSDEEWKTLEKTLGMTQEETDNTGWRGTDEGEKLMRANGNTTFWRAFGDVWANNESGFSAMAGGCRMFDGTDGEDAVQQTGFWWSATPQGSEAWYRYLDYKNKNVFRQRAVKTYGFSIRCIKD